MSYNHEFGERLRKLRKRRGLTQKELATEIGCDTSHISRMEKYGREPSTKYILKIAHFFNISIDYLIHFEGRKKTTTEVSEEEYVPAEDLYGDLYEEVAE